MAVKSTRVNYESKTTRLTTISLVPHTHRVPPPVRLVVGIVLRAEDDDDDDAYSVLIHAIWAHMPFALKIEKFSQSSGGPRLMRVVVVVVFLLRQIKFYLHSSALLQLERPLIGNRRFLL